MSKKNEESKAQDQSLEIDVQQLDISDHASPLYEYKTDPRSNVSNSVDFADVLKQWKRVNTKCTKNAMKNESQININKCEGFRTCNCIKRLIFVMGYYDEWCRKNEKKKKCKGLSMFDIIQGLPGYSIQQLWNDFIHSKQCHFLNLKENSIKVWEYIESKLGIKSIEKCEKFARNNRNRNITGTAHKRESIYFGFIESEQVVAIQFCDVIWEFLFHSKLFFKNDEILTAIDSKIENDTNNDESNDNEAMSDDGNGQSTHNRRLSRTRRPSQSTIMKRTQMRLIKKQNSQNTLKLNNNNTNSNPQSDTEEMKHNEYSDDDRKEFESFIAIRNRTINTLQMNATNKISKFTTEVFDHNSGYSLSNPKQRRSGISFGVSFVYWNGYKSWHTYVNKTSFKNLKEEMLNNPYYKVTLFQWSDTLLKSMKLRESNVGMQWKAKNAGILNKRYGIVDGLMISVAHIMSVLFYTNYKDLHYMFNRNGCRKLSKTETTNQVKQRNRNIGNWYKLFVECITLFGEITNSTQVYYHSLDKQILFDEFKPNFNCMISASSSISVAQCISMNQFSDSNGVIVKLKQQRSLPYGFLNVSWMTDFQFECEQIFSFSRLDVVDIFQMGSAFRSNYVFVKALILFQSILKGHYFEHILSKKLKFQKIIVKMIRSWITRNSDRDEEYTISPIGDLGDIVIPQYMQELFDCFVRKQRKLYVIRSQYEHLSDALKSYLITLEKNNSFSFGTFLNLWREQDSVGKTLRLSLMKEYQWNISGDTMRRFKALPINNTIKGKYFHAGNDVILYPRLRRSDRDFQDKSMMFCYVEDMPSDYNRVYIQWELFCKETNYHSSQTRFLKRKEFAGYTVSNTHELCSLNSFTFEISVQILDIDQK